MNGELDILRQVLEYSQTDDFLTAEDKAEYARLIRNVSEEGTEQIVPLEDANEAALRNLRSHGYLGMKFHSRGSDHSFEITLKDANYRGMRDNPVCYKSVNSLLGNDLDQLSQKIFPTGAIRDTDENKPRPDLISPLAMDRLGHWLRIGAERYGDRNWEKGIPISRSLASLYRHLLKFHEGDRSEDHLAAIMCNAMFILHTEEMILRGKLPESLSDMPDYRPTQKGVTNTIPRACRCTDSVEE